MARGHAVGVPVALADWLGAGWLHATPDGSAPDDIIGASSAALSISPSTAGVAHDKGAWLELVATTSVDLDGLRLFPAGNNTTGTDTSCLLDVGLGASTAEVAVASQIDIGYWSTAAFDVCTIDVPVRIPKGSRIALRVQGAQTTTAKQVYCYGVLRNPGNFRRSPSALEAIGSSTTSSQGTALTAPGATNTKAAWTEISAATSRAFQGLLVCLGMNGTAQTAGSGMADVGIGAAGAEVAIHTNMPVAFSASEILTGLRWQLIARHIPAGSRLVARFQASNTGCDLNASFLGVPY